MRTFLMAAAVVLAVGGPAAAQGALTAQDGAAIRSVIDGQIAAFGRDDEGAAWGYASPGIQALTGSAGAFMDMVRRGYAPVYRPGAFQFAGLGEADGSVVQEAEVTGPDGEAYTARYTMEREPDGSWRIAGCALMKSKRVGV